jgi:hypothetical protein
VSASFQTLGLINFCVFQFRSTLMESHLSNIRLSCAVISFPAKMAEICCLKTGEYAQFNYCHQFWEYLFQYGRNKTHGWLFMRQSQWNLASLENFRKIFQLYSTKTGGRIWKLNVLDRFKTNFDHFDGTSDELRKVCWIWNCEKCDYDMQRKRKMLRKRSI